MFGLIAVKIEASSDFKFAMVCNVCSSSWVNCIEYCVFCIMMRRVVVGSIDGKVVPKGMMLSLISPTSDFFCTPSILFIVHLSRDVCLHRVGVGWCTGVIMFVCIVPSPLPCAALFDEDGVSVF